MSQVESDRGFKYPYLPFATLKNLIERLEKDGVPDRIDRQWLSFTSGVMQSYLIAALKAFALIDGDNRPTAALYELVEKPDERRQLIGGLLRTYYTAQMGLPNNATAGQLDESFKPLQGETKRKAVTFFLHAAQYAQISLSPHFKAPRPPRTSGGSRTQRKPSRQEEASTEPDAEEVQRGGSDMRHTVALNSGGKLTVVLHDGANIFTLDTEDEDFVMGLVRSLRAYSVKTANGEKD